MNARHRDKINELVDAMAQEIKLTAERLGACGAVNLDDYNSDEYVLAKILVTAATRKHSSDYAPLSAEHKRELKNLSYY